MAPLKRTDIALLKRALKTNGGGVTRHWPTPQATMIRLLAAGLLKKKPGESWMAIITKAGREALAAAAPTENKENKK